jgi:hypothetical protein
MKASATKFIEWPAVDTRKPGLWLWSARSDLFWIAGGASLLFGLIAAPVTLVGHARARAR